MDCQHVRKPARLSQTCLSLYDRVRSSRSKQSRTCSEANLDASTVKWHTATPQRVDRHWPPAIYSFAGCCWVNSFSETQSPNPSQAHFGCCINFPVSVGYHLRTGPIVAFQWLSACTKSEIWGWQKALDCECNKLPLSFWEFFISGSSPKLSSLCTYHLPSGKLDYI